MDNKFIKDSRTKEEKNKVSKLLDFFKGITKEDRGQSLGLSRGEKKRISKLLDDCLKESGGEVAARMRMAQIGQAYLELNMEGRKEVFKLLAALQYDNKEILRKISVLCHDLEGGGFKEEHIYNLKRALRSPRSTILKQLNFLEQGILLLVQMREDLIKFIDDGAKDLLPLEEDFANLLNSWFDVGFLNLQRITWDSSASLLQQVIRYEAVHKIQSWSDLENRLDSDRRFYAFFHPRMKTVPLIFVEVALMTKVADSVQEILDESAPVLNHLKANTAIFYSISNTQNGLRGISFGNFLIKKVVAQLKEEFPNLKNFVTISPIPRFVPWLKSQIKSGHLEKIIKENVVLNKSPKSTIQEVWTVDKVYSDIVELSKSPTNAFASFNQEYVNIVLKPVLEMLASVYLFNKEKLWTNDPVLKFHLTNGAEIYRINWQGDTSDNGYKQSLGMMVNYFYDLKDVERNHDSFDKDIKSLSSSVKNMMKKQIISY